MLTKRSAIAVFICYSFSVTAIAQTTDSIFSENKINGIWQKNLLDIIARDNSCSILSDFQLTWDASNNKWINAFRSTYQYPEGKVITLSQRWDALNSTWINSSKSFYNTQGSPRIFQLQVWDAVLNTWINNYRSVETLNDEGLTVVSEFDLYGDNEWQKIQRSLFVYDANDLITEYIFQVWMNNTWLNNNKTTNNYTTGTSFTDLWDAGNKRWTKFQRTFNDYLNNTINPQRSLNQVYSGAAWQNAQRSEATYNSNDQMLSNSQQFWDAGMQAWVNASQINTDYYSSGNINHFEFKGWDAFSNSWSIGFREKFTDINCSQGIQFIPVTQVKNNNTKTIAANTIKSVLNPLASDAHKLVFDVTFNNGQSQQQFQMILSSGQVPQKINSQTKNEATGKSNSGFILSPNPARNYFNINLSAYKNAGSIMLKLTDMSGKLILQQKLNATIQRVDLPSLQKGIYIVTIISGKETHNQKLVIE
jgi:hypothetical protein